MREYNFAIVLVPLVLFAFIGVFSIGFKIADTESEIVLLLAPMLIVSSIGLVTYIKKHKRIEV